MYPCSESPVGAHAAAVEKLSQGALDALVDFGKALLLGRNLVDGLLVGNRGEFIVVLPAAVAGVGARVVTATSGVPLRRGR